MAHTKRAWKLQEFVAHGSNVNCLALGHKSGRVLASGGEDRKVNLWAVGKPNCIMCLQGHTTPVEAVRFGHAEEVVVAGSMSGALKVWDLEQAKIMRTLTGHKSGIRCLDFHPYGDYTASGSLDSNVKLWDIKRKGCIYTYKGHMNRVNCVRFSPDGRWIASAGEDGVVKLWDLTAGKILTDLKLHEGPVNVVEFHPNELLLASGSSDRTIKFWDLETFQMVSSTDGDCTPIRTIYFHPEGVCLYSGATNMLKVHSWEPAMCHDSQAMGWGDVSDIAMAQDQVIGASFFGSNISTYVVDAQRLQPLGGIPVPQRDASKPNDNLSSLSSHRRSFHADRPPTQSSRQSSIPKENVEEPFQQPDEVPDDQQSVADIKNPDDYQEHFHQNSRMARKPVRRKTKTRQSFSRNETEPVKLRQGPARVLVKRSPPPTRRNPPVQRSPPPVRRSPPLVRRSPPPARTSPPSVRRSSPPAVTSPTKPSYQPPQEDRVPVADVPSQPAPSEAPGGRAVQKASRSVTPSRREAQKLDPVAAEDFLPKQPDLSAAGFETSAVTESELLGTLIKGHTAMMTVMANRSRNLQIVRAMWTSGNTKTAVDSALSMNDPAVVVDVLNVLNNKTSLWTLDLCSSLLPHLSDLVGSKYDSYVETALTSVKLILRNMGPVIKANMVTPPSIGVDISREERHRKCNSCYTHLSSVRGTLEKRPNLQGKLGNLYREVQILISTLE
ncbi:LOW QUALITY PROTEIN: katanin p80 WD40 repeat-containing subunit B1-like [Liolophura sinensis]|uniref:LOW QUALITY PROTEIN: katanin p80 WD40 repeat-containing subunit B1-like n=1 Tax=Liolophura sinensis TaxID=3198878 RepID=UPI003158AA32